MDEPRELIDEPNPFSPTEELQSFLDAMNRHPNKSSGIKESIARVTEYLENRLAQDKARLDKKNADGL